MLSAADIERRHNVIGSSDIARIVTGMYGGEPAVVAEKVLGSSNETSDLMELGDLAQDRILDWFCEETGSDLRERQAVVGDAPLQSTCDALTDDIDSPVEAKLVFPWKRDDWRDDAGDDRVSDYAFIQVQYQMLCADSHYGYVAVWFVGDGRQYFCIPRDDGLCDALRERAMATWERVRRRELVIGDDATAVDGWSDRLRSCLRRLPVAEGSIVQFSDRDVPAVDLWLKLSAANAPLQNAVSAMRDRILAMMGTAEIATLPDGRKLKRTTIEGGIVEAFTRAPSVRLGLVKERKAQTTKELTNGRELPEYDA